MTRIDGEQRAEQDRLARCAARSMLENQALGVSEAIALALRSFRGAPPPPPSRSLVLRHLEAMQESLLGKAEFDALCRRRLELVLEVLDLVHTLASPEEIVLAGRIVAGHLEGPWEVHARMYGGVALESIATDLEAGGVGEVAFSIADTKLGRFPRMLFESDGIRFILTRCPEVLYAERERNLFSGEPIKVMGLEELRARVEDGLSPDHP